MASLPEPEEALLRDLARAVARHRRAGGVLDDLPAGQRALLQAMNAPQREVFMAELAAAEAEAGRNGLRSMLGRWQARRAATAPEEGA
ncbi:hypothetical protein [Roseicella aerolata]|uniref:Uncharacterized protein n=1 Tax=Roseicella aerolata TaxID=2883479 RepID=A0A9X1IDV3_9PROT|nr:hypothetical protein [Roseicella aerolata]MCB4822421.1 hypothetical protein [Roseicella aerolata]